MTSVKHNSVLIWCLCTEPGGTNMLSALCTALPSDCAIRYAVSHSLCTVFVTPAVFCNSCRNSRIITLCASWQCTDETIAQAGTCFACQVFAIADCMTVHCQLPNTLFDGHELSLPFDHYLEWLSLLSRTTLLSSRCTSATSSGRQADGLMQSYRATSQAHCRPSTPPSWCQ